MTYYGVEATHARMCKFDGASGPGFRALSTDMRQWVLDAPSLVAVRWEVEELERAARVRNEFHERISPFLSRPATRHAACPSCPSLPSPAPRVLAAGTEAADRVPRQMAPAYAVSARRGSGVSSLSAPPSSLPPSPPPAAHAPPRALLAAAARQDGLVLLDGAGHGLEPVYRLRS